MGGKNHKQIQIKSKTKQKNLKIMSKHELSHRSFQNLKSLQPIKLCRPYPASQYSCLKHEEFVPARLVREASKFHRQKCCFLITE